MIDKENTYNAGRQYIKNRITAGILEVLIMNLGYWGDSYYIDIVMCIDATSGMIPILDEIKRNAMDLYQKFVEGMEEECKDVEQVRIKVIAFRDYKRDLEPMKESEFFVFPSQYEDFIDFVKGINLTGGNDGPKSALEAIALALKSDWTTEGDRQRYCILLFTDAPAHPLGTGAEAPSYPRGMPKDMEELSLWWEGEREFDSNYGPRAGRMFAVVPNVEPWKRIECWNRCYPEFLKVGAGLSEAYIYAAVNYLMDFC